MPADQLRILHWNIHSWRDMAGASNVAAVFGLVRDTDPHVVSLVEVDEPWGASAAGPELAGRLGYAWIFVPAFEYGHDTPAGGFGNALLTKLPVLVVRQRQLVWPTRLYDGTETSECRSVTLAKLGDPARSFWVGSTHLPRDDADARMAALGRLTGIAHELDGHWLVCGDFNTPSSAWLGSDSLFTAFPQPEQPTYPVGQPAEPIDYCIASPGLSVEVEVLPVAGSDHYPVLLSSAGPARGW
jgi:endonuclease/exonuclease/phosphatase family metal-dependent hydrolase